MLCLHLVNPPWIRSDGAIIAESVRAKFHEYRFDCLFLL